MIREVHTENDPRYIHPKHLRELVKLQRHKAIVVSLGFIALLILPILDQWLALSTGFKSTEKRILKPLPVFRFPHVETFIAEFDQYYKENFGWRNALFYQYSQWKYRLLSSSPLPEKVVLGKNGWFYPGNSMNRVVDQHRGLCTISQDTLASIVRHLNHLQDELTNQGAKLYILVAPDSYTIYPENLPSYFQQKPYISNFDRFKFYIANHSTIPVVDARKELISAKSNYVTYCQTDTHWNEFGSLIATLTLVNRMRQDFPDLVEPRLSDYHIDSQKGVGGDLVTMIALNREIVDSLNYKIKPAKFLLTQNTEIKDNANNGLPSQRFINSSVKSPKLLLVGDSFSFSMNQSLPGYFRESYLVRTHNFDMKLAKAEHPDIVVIEIVERNIGLLGLL